MGTWLGFGIVTEIRITPDDSGSKPQPELNVQNLLFELGQDWCLDTSLYDICAIPGALEMSLPLAVIKAGAPELLRIAAPLLDLEHQMSNKTEKFGQLIDSLGSLKDASAEHFFQILCETFSEPTTQVKYFQLKNEPFGPHFIADFECLVLKWEGKTFMEEFGAMGAATI